jgi:hypothetical protein
MERLRLSGKGWGKGGMGAQDEKGRDGVGGGRDGDSGSERMG